MAQVMQNNSGNKYHLPCPRLDMTPMVDLGFLLITFFIFTSSLAESKALNLYMPADDPPSNIGESAILSFLLGANGKLWWYEGEFNKAVAAKQLHYTTYNSLAGAGAVIRQKQQRLGKRKPELMMLIKPGGAAAYGEVVALLDEATINAVKRYAVVDPGLPEVKFLTAGQ